MPAGLCRHGIKETRHGRRYVAVAAAIARGQRIDEAIWCRGIRWCGACGTAGTN